jgi:transcriptional regulator with XRE-family HTH domain
MRKYACVMDASTKHLQLGRAIKRERTKRKLSQDDLAKMAGTTQTVISRIETASQDPHVGTLFKIADALDVPVSEFFSF